MKIVTKKFQSGERYVFCLDEDGVPHFWITHFVTQKLRMENKATSIDKYLKSIKHLKRWECINGRDLLEEIYNGAIPNSDDINKIKQHCTYKVEGLEKPPTKVRDMGKYTQNKSRDKPTVTKAQYITRVAHIAAYLHFCGLERVKNKPTAVQLADELDIMNHKLKSGLPKDRLKNELRGSGTSDISDDAFEDFVLVTKPDSEHNPFKNHAIRLRNYLLVQTLYETGFRRAELVALRISDIGIEVDNPTLSVVRRHDSKDDPRPYEPTAKTLGRSVSISKGLRDLLNAYVRDYRSKEPESKKHPYIFVSHKSKTGSYEAGQPIVLQTLNDIFSKIKRVNSERFFGINPHQYRHFFNDQLSRCIDEERKKVKSEVRCLEAEGKHLEAKLYANENLITEQEELEIRAELNGHSSLDSGRVYIKRTLKKDAKKLRKKMGENLKHKVEGDNDDC